ncbi:MAG TPA: hypothetical protein VH413_03910 [Verrucomicrobiae bacterium]|jgi:hypothetical protein|nr:hypothetical protein [Verrucomicrobiae bacterium]
MIELCIAGFITVIIFLLVFYQNYRDKARWRRISSGMSLFGDRENIPPLELEGNVFEPHEKRVLIIWSDNSQTAFETVSEAIRRIDKERTNKKARAGHARIFAWDGESWRQRK